MAGKKSIRNIDGRRHSIYFTVKAEHAYRILNKKLPKGWINRIVSKLVIDLCDDPKEFIKFEVSECNKVIDRERKKINLLQKQYEELKDA